MSVFVVIDSSDAMILATGGANIIGRYILMPKVKAPLKDYQEKLGSGKIKNMN